MDDVSSFDMDSTPPLIPSREGSRSSQRRILFSENLSAGDSSRMNSNSDYVPFLVKVQNIHSGSGSYIIFQFSS